MMADCQSIHPQYKITRMLDIINQTEAIQKATINWIEAWRVSKHTIKTLLGHDVKSPADIQSLLPADKKNPNFPLCNQIDLMDYCKILRSTSCFNEVDHKRQ